MADETITFSVIAAKLVQILQSNGLGYVCYIHPERVIDRNELPYTVIEEPKTIAPSGLTFSAQEYRYTGNINVHVLEIPDNQLRLYPLDIEKIEALAMKLYTVVYANKSLERLGNIALGEGAIVRFSPNVEGESGDSSMVYGGLQVPYTITIQRSSR